jgi:phage gp16-like protein
MIDRGTLAAIHIAKKDRGMDDDTYRDFLELHGGARSAADLDERGARAVMLAFEKAGFARASKPSRSPADRRPIVRKAQALWIMLWNLDEVASGHDKALTAFAKRITGKDALRFATNGEMGKVVEALKEWCTRAGVDPDTTHATLDPLRRLYKFQRRRLGLVATRHVYDHELRSIVNTFGVEIRKRKLGSRHKPPSQDQGEEA